MTRSQAIYSARSTAASKFGNIKRRIFPAHQMYRELFVIRAPLIYVRRTKIIFCTMNFPRKMGKMHEVSPGAVFRECVSLFMAKNVENTCHCSF